MTHPWTCAGTVNLEKDGEEYGGELGGQSLPLLILSLHCGSSKCRGEQALNWTGSAALFSDLVPKDEIVLPSKNIVLPGCEVDSE